MKDTYIQHSVPAEVPHTGNEPMNLVILQDAMLYHLIYGQRCFFPLQGFMWH